MIEVLLFAMVIASAVSLLVVSPGQAQQRTLRALREYEGTETVRAYGGGEDSANNGEASTPRVI
jgi:hypothetical protein